MNKLPILARIEENRNIARVVAACLQPHGLEATVDANELHIRDKYIAEHLGSSQRVSRAILDTMFPHYRPLPAELFHYSSIDSLRSIAAANEFRLYAVRKRIDEGELSTFAKAHNLDGYLDETNGPPFYKELSDDLFYTSLTNTDPSNSTRAPSMWAIFAKGTGVCLRLRLSPKAAELRSIQYERRSESTLLQKINEALAAEGKPPFVPWTLSRIGAFYLSSTMQDEDEVRLLIKRHKDGPNLAKSDGSYEYWPLPLGTQTDVCKVEVIGITAAPSADRNTVLQAIKNTPLANVPIT